MIASDQSFALLAVIALSAAFGYWIDSTPWGKRIPGILVAIVIPMALRSGGILPGEAPLYDALGRFLIPLAVPLVLFQADFRRIYRLAGPMLLIFALGTVATLAAVSLGVTVFDLGPDAAAFAAVLAASDIGGSSNLIAVSQIVDWASPASLPVALAADALAGTTYWLIILALPMAPFLRRLYRSPIMDDVERNKDAPTMLSTPSSSAHMMVNFGASALIVALAMALAERLGAPHLSILVISGVALLVANLVPRFFRADRSAEEAGMILIYLFMPVIGALTDLRSLTSTSLNVVGFAMTIVFTHLLLMGVMAKLFSFDIAETLIASCAGILGPPSTVATAATFDWRTLVVPGFMCAVLGNAIANFIGVAVYRAVLALH